MKGYDVIVAGVGSMGAAACCHLARRGARVLGIERFDIPHCHGSHHGHSRMIRQSYYEHPDYVPLLRRAYELWDELEEEEGGAGADRILHLTGGLYLGPPEGSLVPGALRAARTHQLPHELLGAGEVAERFPQFAIPGHFKGFFEEKAGFLVPELAVAAHARQARAHGAELRAGEIVLDWSTGAEGVRVRTAGGEFHADHLVVTAGAWSGPLLRDLGIPLTVTRQVLAWFEPEGAPDRFGLGRFPCWFVESDPPFGHYGFPMLGSGQRGLKVALHAPGGEIDPEALGEPAHAPAVEEIASLREALRTFLPGADGPLLAACTCLYTNSPDSHFVLGAHPLHDRLTLAAGFSGHGFKFASVLGEVLADLALDGRTAQPIGFLSPQRFAAQAQRARSIT